MSTKLTLTIEQDVIKMAKTYASKQGKSLSKIIENYLKALVRKDSFKKSHTARVKNLTGVIKLPKDFDYKKTLAEEINKKYGK